MALVRKALKNNNNGDTEAILKQLDDDMFALTSHLSDQRNAQRDAMLAKLAARRRLKEEMTREKAVAEELEALTRAQVSVPPSQLRDNPCSPN